MNESPFSLQGMVVLVTGASSGIGRATASLCADLGATMVLCGRDPDRLEAARASLSGTGHVAIRGDLTDPDARRSLVEAVPPLDGFVFSAGSAALVPVRMISERHLQSMFSVNYDAPVMLTQGLLAKKKFHNGASLVYVTAIADHVAPSATAAYSGAKAALTAAVRTIAIEHAKQGIRANCVSPGYVETPMLEKLQSMPSLKDKFELSDLGSISPADVAMGIAYLISPASRWVTRSSLVIDGGISLHVR
jgi:NAD(P)-dependent dehydrogenase (short-subunit alcohol dehydrogenase family)